MEIPSEYQFCPYDLSCSYYYFVNNAGDCLFVDCFKNTFGIADSEKITEAQVKEITSLMFFAEGDKANLDALAINYTAFSKTMVNGISVFVLEGNFAVTSSENNKTGFGTCFFATKESIYFVSMQSQGASFDKSEELLLLLGDVKINGTFLKGNSPSYEIKFPAESFKDVVARDVQNSFTEFAVSISDKYAQEDASANQQEYEEIRDELYTGAYVVSAVSITLLVISVIYLFKKYKRKKEEQSSDK